MGMNKHSNEFKGAYIFIDKIHLTPSHLLLMIFQKKLKFTWNQY